LDDPGDDEPAGCGDRSDFLKYRHAKFLSPAAAMERDAGCPIVLVESREGIFDRKVLRIAAILVQVARTKPCHNG
jgi:hypothetical protein